MTLISILLAVITISAALALLTRHVTTKVEQAIPPCGKFLEVTGVRLHYIDQGGAPLGKPAIVMIHGLGAHLHHFKYALVDELSTDTRVIAIDRPGSGYSARKTGSVTTLTEQADAVVALLDGLRIKRALFVGHSLGGALSLTLALRHPNRVAGLALIAPLTHHAGRFPRVFLALNARGHFARRFVAMVLATPGLIIARHRVLPIVFGPETVPCDYRVRGGGLLTLRPSQYIGASEDLEAIPVVLPSLESQYETLNRSDAPPIAVLYGREDAILDYRIHGTRFAERVPLCRLEVITGGHMLPLTQPERVARFVRDVLARSRG
ncbi:MAG: alpha/beta fold hydrolase [Gammaproteobacteria bacterium]|nr:alpha/beta fold hydrolase [Gammaproteobacteria bacterium]